MVGRWTGGDENKKGEGVCREGRSMGGGIEFMGKEGRIVGGFEGEDEVVGTCAEGAGKECPFFLGVLPSFSPSGRQDGDEQEKMGKWRVRDVLAQGVRVSCFSVEGEGGEIDKKGCNGAEPGKISDENTAS